MEQLMMSRDNKEIPRILIPEGYYMRGYINNNGDGEAWCKCCIDGSLGIDEISESAFENKMLKDKSVNPENIFFIVSPSGEIAGTTTYQYTDVQDTGCIHMVAVQKNHQGKKLSLPIILYAVQKMLDDGVKKIILTTDDWRIPAIKTYLNAGFLPVVKPGDIDMANRWTEVMKKIKQ